jgi:hypothetical protein
LTTNHNVHSPPRSQTTGHKSRHIAQLAGIPFFGNGMFIARLQQLVGRVSPSGSAKAALPSLLVFGEMWQWLLSYLRDILRRDIACPAYPDGASGIYTLTPQPGQPVRIAVASDWATGTLEAETIAAHMLAGKPDYTVHLGDVYFVGDEDEVEENCLGKARQNFHGVRWPMGRSGSFALMGNHEMYAGGHAYVKKFLPTLGLTDDAGHVQQPQGASYFCLLTEHWVLLGLDSGYHSGGVPLFSSVPWLRRLAFLNVDARFDPVMLSWLERTLATLDEGGHAHKPIILLTHHQPMSSFEHAFVKPLTQLIELGFCKDRELLWLYGHEHRLTVYEKQTLQSALTLYPRCIGHGGMPVEVSTLKEPDARIAFYDPRTHAIDEHDSGTQVGYNGHIALTFHEASLTIEYRDIVDNQLILQETFTPSASALAREEMLPADSPLRTGMQPNKPKHA